MMWRNQGIRSVYLISLALFLSLSSTFSHAAGVNWTWVNPVPQGNNIQGVAVGTSLFVAVGDQGTALSSPDGISWTTQATGSTKNLWAVVWNGTQFIASGDAAGNRGLSALGRSTPG